MKTKASEPYMPAGQFAILLSSKAGNNEDRKQDDYNMSEVGL
jgi:hypothetical protein